MKLKIHFIWWEFIKILLSFFEDPEDSRPTTYFYFPHLRSRQKIPDGSVAIIKMRNPRMQRNPLWFYLSMTSDWPKDILMQHFEKLKLIEFNLVKIYLIINKFWLSIVRRPTNVFGNENFLHIDIFVEL